jgi:hypothetical protein
MAFNPDGCYIPSVYCGNEDRKYPYREGENEYMRAGTRHECMQKGFGAALAQTTKKTLPRENLQQIRFVGPKFEQAFKSQNIHSTRQLLEYARRHSTLDLERLLTRVFQTQTQLLYGKGYNSVLLWLYRNGTRELPQCTVIPFR